jgi:hypothetical protein
MSTSLDIVVHCWAADLPHYAQLLRAQIDSLMRYTPNGCDVQLIVGCAREDKVTQETLYQFTAGQSGATTAFDRGPTICHHYHLSNSRVKLCEVVMSKGELFRRAILRHKWTQRSDADVLWFADCDYAVGEGTVAAILAQVQKTDGLAFPRHYWISNDHAAGDRTTLAGVIEPSQFHQRRSKTAIGGIQIIGAQYAKRIGYLGGEDSKWQQPDDPSVPFRCFRDDSAWRRYLFPNGAREIDVPNLFRVRHSLGAAGSKGPANIG